jgi:hypothetical protein
VDLCGLLLTPIKLNLICAYSPSAVLDEDAQRILERLHYPHTVLEYDE